MKRPGRHAVKVVFAHHFTPARTREEGAAQGYATPVGVIMVMGPGVQSTNARLFLPRARAAREGPTWLEGTPPPRDRQGDWAGSRAWFP